MSQENVELVRGAFEDFVAGKKDFGAGLSHPDVEWDASELAAVLDIDPVYRGPEGVRDFWREWLSAWGAVLFEYELVDAGEKVVVLIDQHMRGRSTGIDVPMGKYAQVYTIRDGLIVHWKIYMDQSEALRASGVK
jgi:ketosteroid isomerase-like protein